MKILAFSMLAFFSSHSAAVANSGFNSPLCQTKLLEVTTNALLKEFPNEATNAGYFQQVTFNYGIKSHPRTVFFGNKLDDTSKPCLVQVYTLEKESSVAGSCPEYVFSHIDSNCK